jgi:diguanylate cyclase (GGDEF)-like protein
MWHALDTKGEWHGEMWNRRKNGEIYAEQLSINIIYNSDGSKRLHVGLFSDVTAKKKADNLIWQLAHYDNLTLLPNRKLFYERLEKNLNTAVLESNTMALLFVDLDRFKEVNDTLGHHIGDGLLQEVAVRINETMRETDTIARIGGDEFTIILTPMVDNVYAQTIAKRIIDRLSKSFMIEGNELHISASIGIACYPNDGDTAGKLLKNADIAMYAAKNSGRARFCFFTKD